MKTVTICIGNSDNKLTQEEWALFCKEISWQINRSSKNIFFEGFSNSNSIFQNACWVFSIEIMDTLKIALRRIRENFSQDSVAVIIGETEFI